MLLLVWRDSEVVGDSVPPPPPLSLYLSLSRDVVCVLNWETLMPHHVTVPAVGLTS